ncbi:MAG: cytochrome c-type biogenesis CcmF C-terminal domain-containing protein, partial [Candidatus Dormibacterales bacterium]
GATSVAALIALPLAGAAAATSLAEYGRLLRRLRSRPARLGTTLVRKRRRYGAYLAHLGLVVLVVGIAASHIWQQEKDVTLMPGQQVTVAGNTLTYGGVQARQLADHTELVALMKFGGQVMEPARATYAGLGGQSLTHVAITTTPVADIYVVLAGTGADGSASFRVFFNPLVSWIWAGGAVIILGVVLGNLGAPTPAVAPAVRRVVSPVLT